MTASIFISQINVCYGQMPAVDCFELSVGKGEMVVLLGASGCGKSTILNSVAGTIVPSGGRISIGDNAVFDHALRIDAPPEKRNLGMVFQSYALWPHKSVAQNVAYPLQRRRLTRAEIDARVSKVLSDVKCGHLAERYPSELSGGQQQRVALARAIVAEPQSILFDEPLSNLDAALRRDLREQIQELQQRLGFTGLYVTHDQEEALGVADRVLVLRERGHIGEIGSPLDVYRRPQTAFGAEFFGANILPGQMVSSEGQTTTVRTGFGDFRSIYPKTQPAGPVAVAIYPERIQMQATSESPLVVESLSYLGKRWECVIVERENRQARIRAFSEDVALGLMAGSPVLLSASPEWVFLYPEVATQ